MIRELKTAVVLLLLIIVISGVVYPAAMAGFTWVFFRDVAGGQLVKDPATGQVVGSRLIGQHFDDPVYFYGRPSMTKPAPYTPYDAKSGAAAGGSNMGPNDVRLVTEIKARVERLQKEDLTNIKAVPVELVTASGSGLDPDISPEGAYYQVSRVARLRGVTTEQVRALVAEHVQERDLGLLGEPRVNVLELNMALDVKFPVAGKAQNPDKAK
jgi:potassium-transporting ATPase KdpC subunit